MSGSVIVIEFILMTKTGRRWSFIQKMVFSMQWPQTRCKPVEQRFPTCLASSRLFRKEMTQYPLWTPTFFKGTNRIPPDPTHHPPLLPWGELHRDWKMARTTLLLNSSSTPQGAVLSTLGNTHGSISHCCCPLVPYMRRRTKPTPHPIVPLSL